MAAIGESGGAGFGGDKGGEDTECRNKESNGLDHFDNC